jgi:DMSO/TMAO reductase YedYZ molybdopterin-dependent catalytic subunit
MLVLVTSTPAKPLDPAPAPRDLSPGDPQRWPWALAGVVAAVAGSGAAQLLAVVTGPSGAPIVAASDVLVNVAPAWLANWAKETLGTSDKAVLIVGAVVVLGVLSAGCGVLARRRLPQAQWAVLALGAVGALAAATRSDASALAVVPSFAGGVVGAWVLRLVTQRLRPHAPSRSAAKAVAAPDRRAFLSAAGLAAGAGVVAVGTGSALNSSARGADTSRAQVRLPAPTASATLAPNVEVGVPGVVPFRVPNPDFYRIDTALVVPRVTTQDWRLRIHGMVDRELTVDYAALSAATLVERDVTLCCVSNEVGGDLIGNARWLGLPIGPLLAQAGPHPDADMVLSTSVDGWTAGTPLRVLTDGRDALLAIGMNGEPLPIEHGFPVRMVVPGLYGYVSATKWVVDLEVTRFDEAQGYWTPRGWSALGPVKTESRIDVPKDSATVRAGRVAVAGVAWAQHRGISGVEVQVDDGAWQAATLGAEASVDTWRQWVFPWQATAGKHLLRVRGTDRTGTPQTSKVAPPAPDGASGWHTIEVGVT